MNDFFWGNRGGNNVNGEEITVNGGGILRKEKEHVE